MAATVNRLRHLLRPFIISSQSYQQTHFLFSSLPDYVTSHTHSLLSNNPEEQQQTNGSILYRKTLKTQRPETIRQHKELENSVSFIGTVNCDVKSLINMDGRLWAYTQLKVESPLKSNNYFTILLNMWEDMAELSIQHLKRNDYIYVSGYLRAFTKASECRKIIHHKVIVKEINFVANNDRKNKFIEDQEESPLERQRKRLYLWQVFFANPFEWRDLRKCKVNPNQPDFKHKGTGESLWLKPHDPPWISRQLELQDSRMVDICLNKRLNSRSILSTFDL